MRRIDTVLRLLREGEVELAGQFVWGSNFTYLTRVLHPEGEIQAVYKPTRGERPLWDFPYGTLAAREVAAYLTSEALGWDLVPPTVLRRQAPLGPGSLQFYVEADPEVTYFNLPEEMKQRLRPVALFDALINNADRKGGHLLLAEDGHLWLIDHGVCFHHQDKLRTVIWDFAGEPIPEDLLRDLQAFCERLEKDPDLRRAYLDLLAPEEVEALQARAARLLASRRFPRPGPGRAHPWPLV